MTSLVVQPDGKILAGGTFGSPDGQARAIKRLNVNGTVDTAFNPVVGYEVRSLALQTDGRILMSGQFDKLNGQARSRIARLHADGTLDATFNPGASNLSGSSAVYSLAVQADGKVLVGGEFSTLGGQARYNIGRLNNTGPASQNLAYEGSSVIWWRSGTSPEVWRTTFEASTNRGADWFSLGNGARINGGWQLTGVSVATDANIRARGFVAGGDEGSGWFVENVIGPVLVTSQPQSRTNNYGTVATFTAFAVGTAPSYQWLNNGLALSDGGNLLGAQTSTLTVSNVFGGDAGGYSVIVSNVFGSVTSQVATLTVVDPLITGQPVSRDVSVGDTVEFSVAALGTVPLSHQWRQDGVAVAGATVPSLVLTNVQGSNAGGYDVVISNSFGSVTSVVARLNVNLATVDFDFIPEANSSVYALAEQADGRILIGGNFTSLGGQARTYLGRLNPDGTLDTAFNPGASNSVTCFAVQRDGSILVGGGFTALGGQTRNRIGRLNRDGTLDTTFDPGANGSVNSMAIQPDGKILVGGAFTMLGGQTRNRIGRLTSDGSLDTTFDPGANNSVLTLVVQADGKILMGGNFTALGGQARSRIARINSDGTLDPTFDPGASSTVNSLAVDAGGKILVGGAFTTLGGQTRNRIGRLTSDGAPDTTFNPGANNSVLTLVAQAEGKILMGGNFTTLGGQACSRIGRLNVDGTMDTTFNPGASGSVSSLALQVDGNLLVGGTFTTLGGQARSRIGRLHNTEPATQSLTHDGSTVTWLRGGSSPEVWRTTFEISTNGGLAWSHFGEGTRIPGGWQPSGVPVIGRATLRARGFTTGGQYNGSSWYVESRIEVIPPPRIHSPSHSADGRLRVQIEGTAAQVCTVEASTNLLDWEIVGTVTLPANGAMEFEDAEAGNHLHRFYRVVTRP